MTPGDSLDVVATHEGARAIGPWLTEVLADRYLEFSDRRGELELAVHEVVVNVIDHAYDGGDDSRSCQLSIQMGDPCLVVTCVDQGSGFEAPTSPRELGGEPMVRGYGLLIVEQLATSLSYDRVGEQNLWRLTFDPATSSKTGELP